MNIANRIAPALDRACEFEDARISRHEAEERAKMLDAIFEAMPDGVLVCDTERRVTCSNRAYRELAAELGQSGSDTAPLPETMALSAVRDSHGRPLARAQSPIPRLLRGESLYATSTVDLVAHARDGHENPVERRRRADARRIGPDRRSGSLAARRDRAPATGTTRA